MRMREAHVREYACESADRLLGQLKLPKLALHVESLR